MKDKRQHHQRSSIASADELFQQAQALNRRIERLSTRGNYDENLPRIRALNERRHLLLRQLYAS